jgi:hypothetical protein
MLAGRTALSIGNASTFKVPAGAQSWSVPQ